MTFIEKGYIIGVRWVISGVLQLNIAYVKQFCGRKVSAAVTIPVVYLYGVDIGLRIIPWRTTNNFMLLGVRLFFIFFSAFDEKMAKLFENVGRTAKKSSLIWCGDIQYAKNVYDKIRRRLFKKRLL